MPDAKASARRLGLLYNLTEEDRQKISDFQKNVCGISKRPPYGRRLAIDHCHRTGLIRGLLDWRVNKGLAYFNDDPALLRAAAAYLENPPALAALGVPRYGLLGKAQKKRKMVYGSPTGPVQNL